MFRFKQFSVNDDLCAMKVGTDGVTLGAWAQCAAAQNILDIGSGSGLIALMLAQRNSTAHITAIDIDAAATEQSRINFAASPWSERLTTINNDVTRWSCNEFFDLIVCNPPYFINSLQAPDPQRSIARHSDTLTLASLMAFSSKNLTDNGLLSIITPIQSRQDIILAAAQHNLHIARQAFLFTTPHSKVPKRLLTELTKNQSVMTTEQLIIGSPEYQQLTTDFYL